MRLSLCYCDKTDNEAVKFIMMENLFVCWFYRKTAVLLWLREWGYGVLAASAASAAGSPSGLISMT